MGISFTDFTGGSSKLNNFAINIGSSGNTTFQLDRTYSSGSYAITFVNGETTYDIYAVSTANALVGYTSGTAIDISENFNKLVIIGSANNEQVFFEYRGEISTPQTSGDIDVAGAYVLSAVTSSLPNVDDSTVINGGNFASDVEVYFIGQDNSEIQAKSVIRSSTTQLIATRPDALGIDNSPYKIKVVNPGVQIPLGSENHIIENAVTAGTFPSWITGSSVLYNLTQSTSVSLSASDTENSDIDYTIVSGTLPAGLQLDSETGVISGIFSGSASEGDSVSITFRATDAGGNYTDKDISLIANASPTWITASGAIDDANTQLDYSYQLDASTGSVGGELTYSISSGSLPSGTAINSAGLISGIPDTEETANFIVRITDTAGAFSERAFSITSLTSVFVDYFVLAGGGGGGGTTGGSSGGAGSGYIAFGLLPALPDNLYGAVVGAGGSGGPATSNGASGSASSFYTFSSIGGAGGIAGATNGSAGGSGGGGTGGNPGGFNGSDGQGAGGAGSGIQLPSWVEDFYGQSVAGGFYGGGYGGAAPPATPAGADNSGAGGPSGTAWWGGRNGGSGVVILRYADVFNITIGAGLTGSTDTTSVPGYHITTITSGSGDVSWQ